MMASYAAALIEELQHKVGDVERAARVRQLSPRCDWPRVGYIDSWQAHETLHLQACLEQGSWTPNSTESSTRELHNYLQQLQYLLDRCAKLWLLRYYLSYDTLPPSGQ